MIEDVETIDEREIARRLSRSMQCNCDLDNWVPENSTGHSHVCRIHKKTKAVLRGDAQIPVKEDQ